MTSYEGHRSFLNSYYGKVKHVYDLSRKYYLFGRDRTLKEILGSPWESLVEIGPGTGRNLAILHSKRPDALYGGVEASDEMLDYAKSRCPWAKISLGFAETADLTAILGKRPQCILFSYCLSMVQSPEEAILNARRSLAPGGEVWIVDFGDFGGLPGPLRKALKSFLNSFHVTAVSEEILKGHNAELTWGPGRYYVSAKLSAL